MWLFMVDRPGGVTLVAILTFLSSGALAFWFLLSVVLLAVGGASNPPVAFVNWLWYVAVQGYLTPLFLSVFALVLSIAMFLGRRFAWYGSIVFWTLLLIYFGWYAVSIYLRLEFTQYYHFQIALAALVPLIYAGACLIYFQTDGVKDYFRVLTA